MSKSEDAPFVRAQARTLATRLAEPRRFLQVVAGPRQVGKTTLVRQALTEWAGRGRYAASSSSSGTRRGSRPDTTWGWPAETQWMCVHVCVRM